MKTNDSQHKAAVRDVRDAKNAARGIVYLRAWLLHHRYEKVEGRLRTGLLEQKNLVETVREVESIDHGVLVLVSWLVQNGYETSTECDHELIVRKTGQCFACGVDPNQEVIEKLRDAGTDELRQSHPTSMRAKETLENRLDKLF